MSTPDIPHPASVSPSEARTEARVTFSDGRVYSAPIGTPLLDYIRAAYPSDYPNWPTLAALVDDDLRELTLPIVRDVAVKPLSLRTGDGHRIYRRSLAFVMVTAADELYPGVRIEVQHSISTGGNYCEVMGRPNFSAEELQAILVRMREIVEADEPITRQHMPLEEARKLFAERGDDDKVRLLEYREKDYLTVYKLRGNVDYFFGYMVATTRALKLFDLLPSGHGFILHYPRPEHPDDLQPYHASTRLESIFVQTEKWLDVMGIEDVGRLNQAIAAGRFREEVLIAEALQTRYLSETARSIAERHAQGARLVLISGPSSAGKTTFSKRLAVQLMAYGIQPYTLPMDNYFVDRELTPRDEAGNYDFEALAALDTARLTQDLIALMQCQAVQLPQFDFKLGKSSAGEVVQLTDGHIIIAEGIHGMNPDLVPDISHERIFRIYVSALTTLNLDRHNRIPTTDIRLLRRMVRDAQQRGHSAEATLNQWESVRRGEKRNIFPFEENADVMFNSGLMYEVAVLRPLVEPMLLQVDRASSRYTEVKRLLAFLSWVRPASAEFVPNDSLLREFVGGSILETYHPGLRANSVRNGGQQFTKISP